MTIPNTAARRTTETLRAAIAGGVFVPGEAGYDQARQAWNLAADQRPSVVVAAGSLADVVRAVRFARAHGMRIAPQGTSHMDPDQPVPNQGDGAFLADLPAAAIDALIAVAGPDADTPLLSVEVRHLGGALARPAPDGGAQPSIDAKYVVFAGGLTPTPELASAVRGHAQAVKNALASWHASYDYYNFDEAPAAASEVLSPASYRRLQKIKAVYDPGQMIISARPVWPSWK